MQPIPPPGYGGIERVLADYAEALRRAGHTPIIINKVRRRRMVDEYFFARELVREARRQDYDVLHASTPVVANRLAWGHVPYVYTTHSRHWFYREKITHRWGYFLERRAVRRSQAVVALTPRLARAIRDNVRPPRPEPRIIPIGVDAEAFRPNWSARTGRRALGVGVVAPFKRWEIAAAALRATGWTLRIIGPVADPGYAARVRSAGDSVEFLGEVDETTLRRLYAESDLLVHPSRVELLAGAVVQGLAAGLPILGCDPIADLVEPEQTGWTTLPGTRQDEIIRAWRFALTALEMDPDRRRSMGESARRTALEKYAWPAVVEQHIALYSEMPARS